MEQLTKAKLTEIERLRATIAKQIEDDGGSHNVKLPEHLDVANWDKFGKEDLKKLILKVVLLLLSSILILLFLDGRRHGRVGCEASRRV
jgi:hypothetical protein